MPSGSGIRNYSNVFPATTVVGSIAATTPGTSEVYTVASVTGLPVAPFTAAFNRGQSDEEAVLVTAVNTGTKALTLTRGYDGTAASAHSNTAQPVAFEHVVTALDWREANAHVNDASVSHAHGTVVQGDVANGYVDLASAQAVSGVKTFQANPVVSGTTGGALVLVTNNSGSMSVGVKGAASGQFTNDPAGAAEFAIAAGSHFYFGPIGGSTPFAVRSDLGPVTFPGLGQSLVGYLGADAGTTTRTTFGSTLTGSAASMTLAFVGPASLRVLVILSTHISASAGQALMGVTVTNTDTGVVLSAASDDRAVFSASPYSNTGSMSFVLAGLTAGANYSAVLQFRSNVSSSTASFDTFRVNIVPSMGS